MIKNKKRYLKASVLLLVLAGCLAGCAMVKSANAGTEVQDTYTQSDALMEEKEVSDQEEASAKTDESQIVEEQAEQVAEQATEQAAEQVTEQAAEHAAEKITEETTETTETIIKDMATIREEYIASLDLEDNPFWDSLVYTGYNIEKHYADGLMWHYVLAAHKRGKGWLSDITYAGGSLGYETTEEGLPDIEFFEKHGLVCASYVSYVYFNYLPNVAGIDTSVLTKPEKSYSANDWYIAAKDWVEQGYSETIDFTAKLTGAGFIDFETLEEMPVGSIIAFCDSRNKSDYCSHVVIYAGYQNDYHWVYHVGNENGPEFCSVQRMHFGPDPQWPIAVITTPGFVMEAITAEYSVAE